MNRVEINRKKVKASECPANAKSYCQYVLKNMGIDDWEVSILFTNNIKIRKLNFTYAGINAATDVLSFIQGGDVTDPETGQRLYYAGDLVISLEYVKDNSDFFNIPYDEELKRVIIHGFLHLSGDTHKTNEPGEPMLIRQEMILKETGDYKL